MPARDQVDAVQSVDGCTIGVLGGDWRGTVTAWGAIQQWVGGDTLHWYVAADDRWHVPAGEPTLRQTQLEGTPVVETRVRVPQGDVVSRVYAVADHGGLTVVEIQNDSPLPVAIAFTGSQLLSVRPPATVPIQGIDLPDDTVMFPVGHHATITVALAHQSRPDTTLPGPLPTALQVARGWSSICDRASRMVLPDQSLVDRVTSARFELMLAGPPHPGDDAVGFLMAVEQLVRMTGRAELWMPDVAEAVESIARSPMDTFQLGLDAAAVIAHRAGDTRAGRDLSKVRQHVSGRAASADLDSGATWLPEPTTQSGGRLVAAAERRLAAGGDLLPLGLPASWLGHNFEVHGIPTGVDSAVSFAVRWHGDRPAVLWECTGTPVMLSSSSIAPQWSTSEASGETLWPEPSDATTIAFRVADDPGSFS